MMHFTFYLKSGASFTVRLKELSIVRNAFGNLQSIKWTAPDEQPTLSFLNLDEVVAVVREESEVA
jgi:hypothetical protein